MSEAFASGIAGLIWDKAWSTVETQEFTESKITYRAAVFWR